MKNLIDAIVQDGITMITQERFNCILEKEDYLHALKGDVVECGVWKGGMSIFLSKLFPAKKIWVCDSYEGCQDPTLGNYQFAAERHTLGMYAVSLEEVKSNFRRYDALDDSRVTFLKGWVRDTLRPEICPIESISLLRVDVDSYSATMEVLDFLYEKVVPGGMIIFDDICLHESRDAIKNFFRNTNTTQVFDPNTHSKIDLNTGAHFPCGCYIIKNN